MIVAFDLATRTGWAHLERALERPYPRIESGYFDLNANGGKDMRWGHKLRSGELWIRAAIPPLDPTVRVVIEAPQQFKSRDAARVCWGMYTLVHSVCADMRLLHDPVEIPGPTLKKWATGSGKAKKPDMIKAAVYKSARAIKDHNEADAVLLALYAHQELKLD